MYKILRIVFLYPIIVPMPRKINQPEFMPENQTPDNTIQQITQEKKSEIYNSMASFLTELEEIEQQRIVYIESKKHKKNDPTLRALNTLRKLEKLPIAKIPQISIPFAEGM